MPIKRLASGGIIANYLCPAACGHCLYGCSPTMPKGYISEETAQKVCGLLKEMGCRSLHIGGGEPFLDVDGLCTLVRILKKSGIQLDYIETNAAWVTGDIFKDRQTLMHVRDSGGEPVMVSADPFHVAFIPFWKTAALIRLLDETDTPFFVWQQRYLPLLSRLDAQKTYTREALAETLGYDVIAQSVRDYGMGFNGRALNLLREQAGKKPAEDFLKEKPCSELSNTGHFHVDLYGRFISSGCTGMGMELADIANDPDEQEQKQKYPVLAILHKKGLSGLWKFALEKGYAPSDAYSSKCELCFSLRKFLVLQEGDVCSGFAPAAFYQQDF